MVLSVLRMPVLAASAFVIVSLLVPVLCLAQSSEWDVLRSMVKNMEQQVQKALQRIDQLEKEKTSARPRPKDQVEKSVRAVQSAPSALNPAIGMALDMTAEHRAKTGGTFNFRSAEIGLAASIDPVRARLRFF